MPAPSHSVSFLSFVTELRHDCACRVLHPDVSGPDRLRHGRLDYHAAHGPRWSAANQNDSGRGRSAIDAGSLLTSDNLQQKEIPITEMTKEYNLDTPDIRRGLMGAMVKRNLGVGEAIRSDDLMRPSDHGFMAAVLSPGMRAVTINVDAASGSSGLIWPGDRVDLIFTQVNNDPNTALASGSAPTRCFRMSASSPSMHN